jgi:predicted nucleotidyltransferase
LGFRLPRSEERGRQIAAELDRIRALLARTDVERAILFGSAARGRLHSGSDIDLILVRPTRERFAERLRWAYETLQPRLAMDILVYTPEELEELARTRGFLCRALAEGTVIYDARAAAPG